jgi:hypothetical protein
VNRAVPSADSKWLTGSIVVALPVASNIPVQSSNNAVDGLTVKRLLEINGP